MVERGGEGSGKVVEKKEGGSRGGSAGTTITTNDIKITFRNIFKVL